MGHLRTPEGSERYHVYIAGGGLAGGCRICEAEPVKDFVHWKIVKNRFPYDKVAAIHDMITPKRHAVEQELSEEERAELQQIKTTYLNATYEYLLEAVHKKKSIPSHFHLHLLVAKD